MIAHTALRVRNRGYDLVHTLRLRRLLARHGIVAVREFNRPKWHLGARYYTGSLRGARMPVFVKNGLSAMVSNEARAWKRIADAGGREFLAALHAHDLAGPMPFAAFECIPGESLEALLCGGDAAAAARAARDLVALVDVLNAAGVVHRDVRPANLLLRPDGTRSLALIDFAFAVVDGSAHWGDSLGDEVLRTLGDGLNPQPFVWDDAFSALQIVRRLERLAGHPLSDTDALQARVGRLAYSSARVS
jgi:serine/threonine protein kinase